MLEQKDFVSRMQQVEGLIRKIENVPDAQARASALELVQSLMDFHGAGLDRLMEIVAEAGEAGYAIFDNFARDDLVGSLLLLYGLHPVPLEMRVTQALDKVRPYLDSHGGNVELLGITDDVVRLRLQGSCKSCPSSSMTLKLAIEEAIYAAAPDVVAIEAEGVAEQPAPTGFVQIGKSNGNGSASHTTNGKGWEEVSDLHLLAQSSVQMMDVRGRSILFCRLGESLYAYGNLCPGCGKPLQDARLEMTNLVCSTCGQQFDMIRAGRGLDQPNLHLEPFPLLIEQGRAKVALPN
ncbi:MAG TPA: NifU family protein [Pyrinomonadaceae bacterium]|jgi:Fe-S cluster biogenesis protein NfuA/nitrite reductase/ring-hydroxylating ferredoxin subunit|nr:NifU family protein [Pyrinomonadaceae bacterium]